MLHSNEQLCMVNEGLPAAETGSHIGQAALLLTEAASIIGNTHGNKSIDTDATPDRYVRPGTPPPPPPVEVVAV